MRSVRYPVSRCLAIMLVLSGLAACGSSGTVDRGTGGDPAKAGGPTDAVAEVGSHVITKAELNRWMANMLGEDYYVDSTHRVPQHHLVSDPPNYPACISGLEAIGPVPVKRRAMITVAELGTKCQQLYRAIRQQALTFLVASYWSIAFAHDHGIDVSDAEVREHLRQMKAERFPRKGELENYIANRDRAFADELFLFKLNLIEQRLLKDSKLGGRVNTKLLAEAEAANQTVDCRPEYVVQHCKQYRGPDVSVKPSASVLLEEVARWDAATSHGFTNEPVN